MRPLPRTPPALYRPDYVVTDRSQAFLVDLQLLHRYLDESRRERAGGSDEICYFDRVCNCRC